MLLGQFLQKKALERGVRYKSCHVTHARLGADGRSSRSGTEEGETIAADLFVDCTGFAGLLIDKALKTPFVSFSNNLFNDAAVAIPSPIDAAIPSETVSSALRHGWAWKIPLTSRYGTGTFTARNSARPMPRKPSCASDSVCSSRMCRHVT